MAANSVSLVVCPAQFSCCAGKCGGEAVAATFGRKSVSVDPCSYLLAQGWTGANVVLWHSQAVELQPVAPAAMQHTDGLVVIR